MSEENVAIVRRAFSAFQEGGFGAVLPFLDPEIVWEDLAVLPDARVYRGLAELQAAAPDFFEAFGDLTISAEEVFDVGDSVIVALRWRGEGAASGVPVDALRWNVLTIGDGRIVRRRVFEDRDPAIAAATEEGA